MTIDPVISLAFAVWSSPGAWALLLGSGVSRSAGIPTGWEITQDLIRKVALLEGDDATPDPLSWYRENYDDEPTYSGLLERLARSQVERCQLLRGYFEPTPEERAQSLKVPMAAHHAIARLVLTGYIRVIITTNFDRLLERALEEVGITPTVIHTPETALGALPLTHIRCTIIKPNGDYLDTRIKNTPEELASYDEHMNRVIDQVFDEYGLIVCGWSATWDSALKQALERCPTHRFTTYWTYRQEPEAVASDLIQLRRAVLIGVRDADAFFQELEHKVRALEQVPKPHPLSAKVAAAVTKRHLSGEGSVIQLHEMVLRETERVYETLCGVTLDVAEPYSDEALLRRIESYEALSLPLVNTYLVGCYWGTAHEMSIWTKCLERLGNVPTHRRGTTVWLSLMRYPALLILYAGGIASVASQKYGTFQGLVLGTKLVDRVNRSEQPVVLALTRTNVLRSNVARTLPGLADHYTPLSERLQEFLREPSRQIIPDDHRYERCFDRFEYMLALVYADLREKQGLHLPVDALGCFVWRPEISRELALEQEEAGREWPPLGAGLFDGSDERLRELRVLVDTAARLTGWR